MKKIPLLFFICFSSVSSIFNVNSQCTEAKDTEMAKYKRLTETQDPQGCSQCAMLALYFCSAKYCVDVEDKRKVRSMIEACKGNIRNMGQPYCCPDYLNKEPEWGIMAGSSSNTSSSNSGSSSSSSSTSSYTESIGLPTEGFGTISMGGGGSYSRTDPFSGGSGDPFLNLINPLNDPSFANNELINVVGNTINALSMTYNAQQESIDRDNRLKDLTKFDQTYSSSKEIDEVFERKKAELNAELQLIKQANETQNFDNLQFAASQLNSEDAVVGLVATGLGAIINNQELKNNKAMLTERLNKEYERAKNELLELEKEKRRSTRTALLKNYPNGRTPKLDEVKNDRVFYFAYETYGALSDEYFSIKLTPVIEVHRNPNNTWRLKKQLYRDISSSGFTENASIVGYFDDETTANLYLASLLQQLENQKISYSSASVPKITKKSSKKYDLWGISLNDGKAITTAPKVTKNIDPLWGIKVN